MSKLIDLTGKTFGYWYVLERAENTKAGRAQWLCKCTKCNKTIKTVDGSHLRSGRSKACTSCRQKAMVNATIKDESGKIYGFLKVIRQATEIEKPRTDRTGVYWNCTCLKCGRENIIVFGDYLRNDDTKSCGCLNSMNESKICTILDNYNIQYKTQISFSDLGKGRLAFDIGVYNNDILLYVIEYDGIQHFENGHFNSDIKQTHKNDMIKNKYCFNKNILLIRIPYNKEYNDKDLFLTTTRFLLTPDNINSYYS